MTYLQKVYFLKFKDHAFYSWLIWEEKTHLARATKILSSINSCTAWSKLLQTVLQSMNHSILHRLSYFTHTWPGPRYPRWNRDSLLLSSPLVPCVLAERTCCFRQPRNPKHFTWALCECTYAVCVSIKALCASSAITHFASTLLYVPFLFIHPRNSLKEKKNLHYAQRPLTHAAPFIIMTVILTTMTPMFLAVLSIYHHPVFICPDSRSQSTWSIEYSRCVECTKEWPRSLLSSPPRHCFLPVEGKCKIDSNLVYSHTCLYCPSVDPSFYFFPLFVHFF